MPIIVISYDIDNMSISYDIDNMQCFKCGIEITGEEPKYGLHQQCFTAWFKVDPKYEFVSLTQRSADSKDPEKDINRSANNTSFYHGKFKKYSADLNTDNYILKMRDEKEAPELPEVEYLCNQIANLLGIPVPDFFYIDFNDQRVFVTKVFIKKSGGVSNLEHIYKYRPDNQHNCETLAKTIEETTKRPYDVEVFYNTLLLDALIGNHGRHGKNLAFVVSPSKILLSPIYDNVSYMGLVTGKMLKADFNPTGRIATLKTLEPSMNDYVEELVRLNQVDLVIQFLAKAKIQKINDLVDHSFCSLDMKESLKRLIAKRHRELIDGIQN